MHPVSDISAKSEWAAEEVSWMEKKRRGGGDTAGLGRFNESLTSLTSREDDIWNENLAPSNLLKG